MDEATATLAELRACWALAECHRAFCLSKARTAIARDDVTAEDVAETLGVSRSTLFRMFRELEL